MQGIPTFDEWLCDENDRRKGTGLHFGRDTIPFMRDGYNALLKIVEAKFTSTNTASPKCAEEIMRSLSGRSGIDLYQYDSDIVDDIRQGIVDIISAHIGRG